MDPVSQFRFACPVCGQHLKARVEEVGRTTECPSCFKKLTVPQAPTDTGTKLIITAALADTRRVPASNSPALRAHALRSGTSQGPWIFLLLSIVVIVVGLGLLSLLRGDAGRDRSDSSKIDLWTDKAYELSLFETPAVGKLKGRPFTLTSAIWRDTTLILVQEEKPGDALSLRITFPLRGGELVAGKEFLLGPGDAPFDIPIKITWKDAGGKEESTTIRSGYILRVQFDEVTKATVAGRIHLCFGDPDRSWVAGSFSARNLTKVK